MKKAIASIGANGFFSEELAADENGNPGFTGIMGPDALLQFFVINDIEYTDTDYSVGMWGQNPDSTSQVVFEDLYYDLSDWQKDGVTLFRGVAIEEAAHANTNYQAQIAWDFLSQYACGEDGSVIFLGQVPRPSGNTIVIITYKGVPFDILPQGTPFLYFWYQSK